VPRTTRDYTEEATALFARFARKHELRYEVTHAPVEVMWEFPVQPKLSLRIVLALQNNDELNFGVGNFWSYFFPFEKKQIEFEKIIDKWVEGAARIVPKSGIFTQALELQLLEDGGWKSVYSANSIRWRRFPGTAVSNVLNKMPPSE
jgi:hypothetical protein